MTGPTKDEVAAMVDRLRARSADDRKIQANNEVVAAALMGQRILFDQGFRSDPNTFAVRLGLDYANCAKNDAKLAADWNSAADMIEALSAQLTASQAARLAAEARAGEWQDVVSWLDNGEKTMFDWCAGGADPDGEFSRIGLRRELPDGSVVYRAYVALDNWTPAALKGAKP